MSSIADALKRAEQERERLRGGAPAGNASQPAEMAEASLASVVLRKGAAPGEQATGASVAPAIEIGKRGAAVTPLADALRQTPAAPGQAGRAGQQIAETIVEDYAAKRKLNLPAAMLVYHERAGAIAEQYRKIRDQLMQANPKREPQMLVVTSAMPGEGKTTTVINLGLSLVEVRANRVLLIDGCLHHGARTGRRSLSALLKLQAESGLAELLATPDQDAQAFVKATPWHHLFVLPAGIHALGATSTELLKSAALRQRLRQLRGNFDWVLIDAPAALPLPDAGLLGGSSDGILLAAALHHTPREKVQTAIRRLKSLNLPVKSCILTRG